MSSFGDSRSIRGGRTGVNGGESGILLRADHDLGDEVDDGAGGLLGVVFSKQVAHVVHAAARLPGYETENPAQQLKNKIQPNQHTLQSPE